MFCITCFEYTNLFDTRIWFLLWQKIFLQVISFLLGIFLTTTEQIRLYISVEYFGAVRCWLSNMLVNKCRCVCVFQYVRVKCVCICVHKDMWDKRLFKEFIRHSVYPYVMYTIVFVNDTFCMNIFEGVENWSRSWSS